MFYETKLYRISTHSHKQRLKQGYTQNSDIKQYVILNHRNINKYIDKYKHKSKRRRKLKQKLKLNDYYSI